MSRCIGEDRFVEQALIRAENSPARRYSVREIISAVCEVYGVGVERIRSGGRLPAELRGVAALLSLELPGAGLVHLAPEVARDATSLSSAARRVAGRAKEDDALFQKIETLRKDFAVLQAWPQLIPQLAQVHERELTKGNRNRATLAVARKLVSYMLAVDKTGIDFIPAREATSA